MWAGLEPKFSTQQKEGWLFWSETQPNPNFIGFDPTLPNHLLGQAQAKKLSLMVGSGRVRAEEKSVGFFDPIRPDKWSGLPFLPLIPDVF